MSLRELKLYIGIRWAERFNNPNCRRAISLLHTLQSYSSGSTLPIHWNFPCQPLLEKRTAVFSELIDEIKIRLHNQEDHILPMGYTGALHPILEIKELKREVHWSLQNPWRSGIQDVFDVSPSFMLPFVPDLYREEALSVYLRAGFTRLGIIRNLDAFHTFRSQIETKDGPMELYSLLRHSIFDELDAGALSRVFKKQESARLFLLLDLSSYPPKSVTSETDIIRRFLDGLSRTYNLTFHHLLTGIASFDRDIFTPDDNTVIRPDDDEYSYDLMDNPATRSMMLGVSSLRNHTSQDLRDRDDLIQYY